MAASRRWLDPRVLGGLAAVAWPRQRDTDADARVRGWLLLVGAVVELGGVAWDSWRHAHGGESALGHLLTDLGVLVALVAAVVTVRLQPRHPSHR